MAEAGGQPEEASAIDEFTDIIKSRSGRTNDLCYTCVLDLCFKNKSHKDLFHCVKEVLDNTQKAGSEIAVGKVFCGMQLPDAVLLS